jgi:hypothetical protein
VGVLQFVAHIVYFIATFVILFTGHYPRGMFEFYVGYMRWTANLYGYLLHLYDDYPPFSTDERPYPLTLTVDYPEKSSRLLNLPLQIGLIIKLILTIPHWVVLAFLIVAVLVVLFIAMFAILLTGSFPESMHSFVVGVGRWLVRVQGYVYGLTDVYPPFSTK